MSFYMRWIVGVVICLSATQLRAETAIVPDVVYGRKHGMALTFDVFKPSSPNGAGVLFLVSGGFFSKWYPPEDVLSRFNQLLDNGFTVFAIRHGSGEKYKVPEIVADVRRSVRFIRLHATEYGVDSNRLGVHGVSAGGLLALLVGTTADEGSADAPNPVDRISSRISAVVAFCPVTDLRGKVPQPPEVKRDFPAINFDPRRSAEFSPAAQVSADDAPTLLLHGDRDSIVPLSTSTSILEEFKDKKVKCKLVVVKDGGHDFYRSADKTIADKEMLAWFTEHLMLKAQTK